MTTMTKKNDNHDLRTPAQFQHSATYWSGDMKKGLFLLVTSEQFDKKSDLDSISFSHRYR